MDFKEIANLISQKFKDIEIDSEENWIKVKNKEWLAIARFIKENSELSFDFLSCLSSVDGEEAGFYVVYNLLSIRHRHCLEIRVFADSDMKIYSISSLWRAADWHERSAYVSLPGFIMLAYFGLWVSYLKDDWRLFRGWKAIILPCVLIFVMTIRNFKLYIIPQWIPFLNAERITSRYMVLLLIIIIIISAINLQGFVQKYSKQKRIRILLVSLITVIAGFLFNNSRIWRMHYLENKYSLYDVQHANDTIRGVSRQEWKEKHYNLELHIQNNPEDILYMSLVWIGIVGSCLSLLFYSWWLWKTRKEGLSFYKT